MPDPTELTLQLTDEAANVATFQRYIPDGEVLSDIQEFQQAYAVLVDDSIGGIISKASLRVPVDISGVTQAAPTATGDVQDVGAFVFTTATNRKVAINIPGFPQLKVAEASNDIDQADADVAAFIAAIKNGIAVTAGTMTFCNKGEVDITEIVTAQEAARPQGSR